MRKDFPRKKNVSNTFVFDILQTKLHVRNSVECSKLNRTQIIGVKSDIEIYRQAPPPLQDGECVLGDKAYCSKDIQHAPVNCSYQEA